MQFSHTCFPDSLLFFFFCQDMNRSLNQAIEVLNSRPQTVAEIAEANQKHIEFEKSNKEVFLN